MRNISICQPNRFETATETSIDVGTSSTAVLSANSSRNYVLIANISDTDIFISFGGTATVNKTVIVASGGSYESPSLCVPTCAITAIHASAGTKKLAVTEG